MQNFFSVQGGHGPSGPMVNTPLAVNYNSQRHNNLFSPHCTCGQIKVHSRLRWKNPHKLRSKNRRWRQTLMCSQLQLTILQKFLHSNTITFHSWGG